MDNLSITESGSSEIWNDIPGFEGYYMASNAGRIKSLERMVPNQHFTMRVPERIKSQLIRKNGYKAIGLYKNAKNKYCNVHRLIALSFIPNPENKKYVNHIDGDKTNNSVENLEWVTAKENTSHAWKTGLTKKEMYQGEKCSGAKLKKWQVLEIRKLCEDENANLTRISEKYGVEACTISDIKRRKSWKHI